MKETIRHAPRRFESLAMIIASIAGLGIAAKLATFLLLCSLYGTSMVLHDPLLVEQMHNDKSHVIYKGHKRDNPETPLFGMLFLPTFAATTFLAYTMLRRFLPKCPIKSTDDSNFQETK